MICSRKSASILQQVAHFFGDARHINSVFTTNDQRDYNPLLFQRRSMTGVAQRRRTAALVVIDLR